MIVEGRDSRMHANPDLPLWSQEEAIAYESACECINHLIALYSEEINNQEAQVDTEQDARLKAARGGFATELRALHVSDREQVARIREEYGAFIRQHVAGVSNLSLLDLFSSRLAPDFLKSGM